MPVGRSAAEDRGTQVHPIFHLTPVPGDELMIRVGISVDLARTSAEMLDEVQKKNAQLPLQDSVEDREIRRHERYLTRPMPCAEDGPCGTLRRWTRQFGPP